MDYSEIIARDINVLRQNRPLIHHMTNFVVMNQTANLTLAIGGQPVMSHAIEEVEEMVSYAGCLLLNIGTLVPELIDSMITAGRKANKLGVPVVFDPVGAGATKLRTDSAKRILSEVKVSIIRANLAETLTCAGIKAEIVGVDSRESDETALEKIKTASKILGTVIAVTGVKDVITDSKQTAICSNGNEIMGKVTGTGCSSSTSVACFASVEKDPFIAAVCGVCFYSLMGELAAEKSDGPASFEISLRDRIYSATEEEISRRLKLEIITG
ncbi:hydroxyethylthiazole kinase [candidate division WOR-3 bacterium]|nr:hydroxyethylthiazole kinase [candidate division WOR-3 bacterium]